MSRMFRTALSSLCAVLPAMILCAGCAAQPDDVSGSDEAIGVTPDAVNACRNVAPVNNGLYCGNSTQNGFDPTVFDSRILVICTDRVTAARRVCANRCVIAPPGTPDHCG